MRNALQLFDFDDPSIAHLKMLLLRAAFAPSFLRCVEGRRMIAYMFSLQPAFVAELAAIVKNQIPAGRKSGKLRQTLDLPQFEECKGTSTHLGVACQ